MLKGKAALVAGGAGEVGEGIVGELLKAGVRVIVPSRSGKKLSELRERLAPSVDVRSLEGIEVDATTEAGLDQLKRALKEKGGVDFVVASLGSWYEGPVLTELSPEKFRDVLQGGLHAHFQLARALLPELSGKEGSAYVFINGGAALMPVPRSNPVSVSAAAQLMLTRAFLSEQKGLFPKIGALVLMTPILTRSRPDGPRAWLSNSDVGRAVITFLTNQKSQVLTVTKAADELELTVLHH